ncbi:diacylglycerol/lipid kinase family protein [Chitinophaga alhagiae]|uniref:diacylglycerol/lipid kinase family protein n=1 Tax=Chitinophaga alhagiae TaxID=2203219 RepID=UPI001300A6EF|nr:diacylglycerol kinase family protein [Chitinophaga alhagiae]
MRKILIIINRKAGTDREKRLGESIRRHLPADRFAVETTYLQYLGHGADLARDAVRRGVDTVVAVGGDGSINEVAQGLLGTKTALAIVPLGSGNGLARALKIPLDVGLALQLVAAGAKRPMDAGFANEHLFLSNAGVGFDAVIADRFRHSKKRGLINYARLVIGGFYRYRPSTYSVKVDGQEQGRKAFLMTVANGNQFGYEFKLAPQASVFDGMLDVCLVPPLGFFDLLPLSVRSLRGSIHKSRYMEHFTGKEIEVSSPELTSLQVDGDAVPLTNGKTVYFRVAQGALQVIVPPAQ